jgi:uncharacterized protein (TIGR03437 family)
MRRFLLIIALGFGSLLATEAHSPAKQQTLTIKNFLNPDALPVRGSFVLLEGMSFTDVEESDPFGTPTTLAGVQVIVDGVPQRLRTVEPSRIVFILEAAGAATRSLEVRPKTGNPINAPITAVNAWPSVLVLSTGDDSKAFIPFGLYTNDPSQPSLNSISEEPLPVALTRDTLVIVNGSGWRYAANVSVRLNGIPCKVIKVEPYSLLPGVDQVVFLVPPILANYGPVDLVVSVAGRESNYARLVLGQA